MLLALLVALGLLGAAVAMVLTLQTDERMRREELMPERELRGFEVIMKPEETE